MATARDDLDLLTVAEVARRLRVHRSTVWKLVKSNRLPAVRVTPRITRIPRGAVEAFVGSEGIEEPQEVVRVGETSTERSKDPVIARLRAFQEKLLAKNGGRLFSDSTEILRRIREERAAR